MVVFKYFKGMYTMTKCRITWKPYQVWYGIQGRYILPRKARGMHTYHGSVLEE